MATSNQFQRMDIDSGKGTDKAMICAEQSVKKGASILAFIAVVAVFVFMSQSSEVGALTAKTSTQQVVIKSQRTRSSLKITRKNQELQQYVSKIAAEYKDLSTVGTELKALIHSCMTDAYKTVANNTKTDKVLETTLQKLLADCTVNSNHLLKEMIDMPGLRGAKKYRLKVAKEAVKDYKAGQDTDETELQADEAQDEISVTENLKQIFKHFHAKDVILSKADMATMDGIVQNQMDLLNSTEVTGAQETKISTEISNFLNTASGFPKLSTLPKPQPGPGTYFDQLCESAHLYPYKQKLFAIETDWKAKKLTSVAAYAKLESFFAEGNIVAPDFMMSDTDNGHEEMMENEEDMDLQREAPILGSGSDDGEELDGDETAKDVALLSKERDALDTGALDADEAAVAEDKSEVANDKEKDEQDIDEGEVEGGVNGLAKESLATAADVASMKGAETEDADEKVKTADTKKQEAALLASVKNQVEIDLAASKAKDAATLAQAKAAVEKDLAAEKTAKAFSKAAVEKDLAAEKTAKAKP